MPTHSGMISKILLSEFEPLSNLSLAGETMTEVKKLIK